MQTGNRNMQTDCSTIIAWEFFVKDMNIFNVHDDACSLCVYKSIKKERSASCLTYNLDMKDDEIEENVIERFTNNMIKCAFDINKTTMINCKDVLAF